MESLIIDVAPIGIILPFFLVIGVPILIIIAIIILLSESKK